MWVLSLPNLVNSAIIPQLWRLFISWINCLDTTFRRQSHPHLTPRPHLASTRDSLLLDSSRPPNITLKGIHAMHQSWVNKLTLPWGLWSPLCLRIEMEVLGKFKVNRLLLVKCYDIKKVKSYKALNSSGHKPQIRAT